MSDTIKDLYAEAEGNTEKINQNQDNRYQRDPRLIDMGKEKVVYFRMFPDFTGEKPVLFIHHKVYTWKSVMTKRTVYGGVSPTLWGKDKEDFLRKKQMELYDQGQKEKAKLLYPNDKRLVNVFIIDDSSDPESKGTFKVMNYSAKPIIEGKARTGSPFIKYLSKLLKDKDNGISTEQLYSLGKDGVTFKMTIEETGDDWPEITFEHSTRKTKGFDGFPKNKLLDIYKNKASNLMDMIDEPKSDEDLEKLFRTHVLGVTTQSTGSSGQAFSEDDDDIPMNFDNDEDSSDDTSSSSSDNDEWDVDAMLESMEKEE